MAEIPCITLKTNCGQPARSLLVMTTLHRLLPRCAHRQLPLALLALAWLLTATNSPAATISWSGAGGDDLWSNPLNWNGGALPTSDDDVVINVPGEVTVRMDVLNTTVRSLQCQESFILESGTFTVTAGASVINGSFGMNIGQTLAGIGATTTFTVHGAVTNLWELQAANGAAFAFPTARQLAFAWGGGYSPRWLAYGEGGSAISLTNLTNIVIVPGNLLTLDAQTGGRIDVRRLRVPEGSIRVNAQNINSLIDLSGFRGLWTPGFNGGYSSGLSAGDGGTVLIPNVTALEQVDLYLSGSANVNIGQLRSFTAGTLTLASRTNGFTGLTNFHGSLSAYDSRLDWTNFTVLYATNTSTFSIRADQGSVIDLSRVTNVVMNPAYGMNVSANTDSRIDLRRLRQPDGGLYIYVSAYNAGSLVDLSGLTGLWEGNNSSVSADDGGTVLIPNVTAMSKVSIDLRHDAIVPTEQLRSFTDANITLYSRTNGFAGLTNFTGSFYVTDTRLDLTNFTVLHATNTSVSFQADQGSFIDLSRVTNVISSDYLLYAYAYGGSRIDLRRLGSRNAPVYASAIGANSLVDLSGLNGPWAPGPIGFSYVVAYNGATVLIPNVTAMERVTLDIRDSASVNLGQLESFTDGTISFSSRTNGLEGLTNFTGSLYAYDTRLDLTNFTTLYATNNHLTFQADQGSFIDLSRVTNVVMSSGHGLSVNAYGGGHIDLHRLRVPEEGPVYVDARYADSVIDLSGFNGLWQGYGGVTAVDGGMVSIPNVTAMRNIYLSLSGDAIVPTAQLRSCAEGSMQFSTQTNVFTGLTNFTGTLNCSYLSRATFPSLTQLDATNYSISLTAGNDSVIDLSRVTNALVDFGNTFSLYAHSGGRIELPLLESIAAGNVNVQANGAGAVVDLSGLTGFFSDNNSGSLYTLNGGTILLNPNAMLLAGVAIDFQTNPGGPVPPFLAPSQSLVLYGQPWQSYRVESRNPSVTDSPWSLYKRVPLTEPLQIVSARPPKNLALRVRAFVADPPEVDIRLSAPATVEPVIYGVTGRTYRLETTTSLNTGGWQNGPSWTMTNSFFIFPSAGTTNDARFYRARQL